MTTIGLNYVYYTNKMFTAINNVLTDFVDYKRDKWLHHEYPTTIADLPSVTCKLGTPKFDQISAEDFLKDDISGGVYRRFYARKASCAYEITSWTSRNSQTKSQTYIFNGTKLYLNNALAATAIMEYIRNGIMSNREEFIINQEFVDMTIEQFESSFENGSMYWTSMLTGNLEYYTTWVEEFVNGKLIRAYNLTVNTI